MVFLVIMMSAIGVDGHDAQLKELASAVVDEAVVTTDNGGEGGGDPGLGALGVASAASVSFGEDDLSAATTPRPKGGLFEVGGQILAYWWRIRDVRE